MAKAVSPGPDARTRGEAVWAALAYAVVPAGGLMVLAGAGVFGLALGVAGLPIAWMGRIGGWALLFVTVAYAAIAAASLLLLSAHL